MTPSKDIIVYQLISSWYICAIAVQRSRSKITIEHFGISAKKNISYIVFDWKHAFYFDISIFLSFANRRSVVAKVSSSRI